MTDITLRPTYISSSGTPVKPGPLAGHPALLTLRLLFDTVEPLEDSDDTEDFADTGLDLSGEGFFWASTDG